MLTGYLETDEREDVLCSLRHCLESIERAGSEPAEWKWVILSMHSALQGAMVCQLSGTANLGALSPKSFKQQLDWHERDRRGEIQGVPRGTVVEETSRRPELYLADFKTLLVRLTNRSKRLEGAGGPITLTRQQRADAERLHDLRNDMSHFAPQAWLIELSGLPRITVSCATIIGEIEKDGWPFRHLEPKRLELLGMILRSIQTCATDFGIA